jgi:ABC-type branched-subunit amino acid transport system substrate-binding protein
VVIGAPLPLTGKLADFGLIMRRSLDMAKETINAGGGINGRPLRLVYSDDRGDPDRAHAVIEELIEQAGEASNDLLVATLWSGELPYAGAKAYYDSYLAAYGTAPAYHRAEAYSALLVAADALTRAPSLEPGAIRKALDQTFMMAPFGPVKFYSYENFERQNSIRTQVLRVENGHF